MALIRGLDDAGETVGPIGATTGVDEHAVVVLPHHQAVAIAFDLVDPIRPPGARAALVGMQGSMKPEAGRTLVLERHRMASI